MKICRLCKLEKPLSEFRDHRSNKDRKQSDCIQCNKNRCKERYLNNYNQERTRLKKAAIATALKRAATAINGLRVVFRRDCNFWWTREGGRSKARLSEPYLHKYIGYGPVV